MPFFKYGILYPRFASRKILPEKLNRLRVLDGSTVTRGRGQGTEFDTLREYVMGDDVTLVSSAEETAQDVYRTLAAGGLLRPRSDVAPDHQFLSTGDPARFAQLGRRFLGPEIRVASA